MSTTAIALVLCAAVAHAAWNLAAKFVRGPATGFAWLYATVSAVLCLPLVFLAGDRPQWTWVFTAAVSGLLHVAYSVVLQRGYAEGEMSVVYPLARGTGPLLSVLLAVLVLGERPGPLGLLGAAVVVFGVLVISAGRFDTGRSGTSIGYGVGTGAAIACYTLWDAHSVTTLGVPPVPYFALSVVFTSFFLAPSAFRVRGQLGTLWRAHWKQVVIVAVLSPAAYMLVLQAMTIAPVALVAPARESSIVLGALAGWLILGESHPGRRIVGSVIALSGIVAIALS